VYSLDCPTGQDHADVAISTEDIIDFTAGRVGCYIKILTWVNYATMWRAYYDANNQIYVQMRGTSSSDIEFQFVGMFNGSELNMTTGTTNHVNGIQGSTFFVEFYWNVTTDIHGIVVDGVSKETSTLSINEMANYPANLEIGMWESGLNANFDVDQFLISNDSTRDLYTIRDLTSFPDS